MFDLHIKRIAHCSGHYKQQAQHWLIYFQNGTMVCTDGASIEVMYE